MKKFDKDGKINFVDENNVLVGFCSQSCCCEDFGWGYYRSIPEKYEDLYKNISDDYDIEQFSFDKDFILHVDSSCEDGGTVVFKLVSETETLYLAFWNHHNGYYSHGLTMTDGANEIFSEYL